MAGLESKPWADAEALIGWLTNQPLRLQIQTPHRIFFLLGNYKHLKFEQPNRVDGLEHRHWGQTAWL